MKLESKVPKGPLEKKWEKHKFDTKLINPANKRKYNIIVVGSGLAGASAASTLAELGYNVSCFCIQDSPRRAHSIAAQGGINAAKNYQNDGDSVYRLFYDTIKGGDYRSREANVYRLAQISNQIIDHCVAQGVPFAREYGGLLDNRSFGGAQVSRTFYARGQTGQQLLLGAYASLNKQIAEKKVKMYNRREMLDLVVIDGKARGIIVRNLITGEIEKYSSHAVLLCTGGYGNVFYLSTNAMASNVTATFRAHKRGAGYANPCFTQIHPTCIPVSGEYQSKLTLMSESLRNDGRVWVSKTKGDNRHPSEISEEERDYYLERRYPSFGNLVPRDVASRAAKERCDAGYGAGGEDHLAVYLDFENSIKRIGEDVVRNKYSNLFQMYEKITGEDPYKQPMKIYPAVHYTMGGLWVDYNLMSNIDGLFVLGEANFSDHGANRLGASALMQGLADGYFIIPYTLGGYLGSQKLENVDETHPMFESTQAQSMDHINKLININGKIPADEFHRNLGKIMWKYCGMSRSKKGLQEGLEQLDELSNHFWNNLKITGETNQLNNSLEKANRISDFIEFAKTMCLDALNREESCGGHFREEHQTQENEAKRDDKNFCYVSVWEYQKNNTPQQHKENLTFENVTLTTRSYK